MRVVPSDRGVSPWEGTEGPSVTAARYVDLNPVPWVLRRAWSQVAVLRSTSLGKGPRNLVVCSSELDPNPVGAWSDEKPRGKFRGGARIVGGD